jgi:hypothetical protein
MCDFNIFFLLFPQDEHIRTLNIHCWMVWVSNILYLALAAKIMPDSLS